MRLSMKTTLFAAALCLAIGLVSCRQGVGHGTLGVSVNSVADDPDAYFGSTITVSGEVDEVITPLLFTISGSEDGEELLVLSVDSIAAVSGRSTAEPVQRRDIVQVTGRLRPFKRAELEDEHGADFGGAELDFEGRPVIIAHDASAELSSVVVTPRQGTAVTPPGEAEAVTRIADATAGSDAGQLAGEAAHLRNIRVAEVIDEHSFWATEDGDSLLVFVVPGSIDEPGTLQQGQALEVYGILRQLPPSTELAAEWELSENLVRRLEDDELYLHGVYAVPRGQ